MDIVVKKRSGGGYKAYLADNSKVWEHGKTKEEAIGKLVISARDFLGITILD